MPTTVTSSGSIPRRRKRQQRQIDRRCETPPGWPRSGSCGYGRGLSSGAPYTNSPASAFKRKSLLRSMILTPDGTGFLAQELGRIAMSHADEQHVDVIEVYIRKAQRRIYQIAVYRPDRLALVRLALYVFKFGVRMIHQQTDQLARRIPPHRLLCLLLSSLKILLGCLSPCLYSVIPYCLSPPHLAPLSILRPGRRNNRHDGLTCHMRRTSCRKSMRNLRDHTTPRRLRRGISSTASTVSS